MVRDLFKAVQSFFSTDGKTVAKEDHFFGIGTTNASKPTSHFKKLDGDEEEFMLDNKALEKLQKEGNIKGVD